MESNPASSTMASVSLKRNASSMDNNAAANAKRVRSDEPPPGHPHSTSPAVHQLQSLPVTRTVEFALKRSPSGSAPAAASNDPPPPPAAGPTTDDPDAAFRAAVLAKLAEASSGSSASPSTASTRTGPLPPANDQPTVDAVEEEHEEEEDEEEETDDPDADRSDGGWDDEDEWVPPAAAAVPRNSSSIAPEANASGSGQSLISPPPTPVPGRTDAASSLPPAPPPVVAEPTPDVPTAAAPDVATGDASDSHAATTAAYSATVAEHEQLPNADVDDDWLEAVAPSNFALPDEPWATSPPTLPLDDAEELSPLTQPTHPPSPPPPISALRTLNPPSDADDYADSGDEPNQDVPVAPGFALRGSDGAKVQCALCGRWMGPEKTAEHVARLCGTIPKPERERKPKRRSTTTRRMSSSTPKLPRSPRKEKPVMLPAAKLAARRAELDADRWAAQLEDARGVQCAACGVWVDVGGAGLGAVQRWSGRTGHKSVCGEIVETVKREEAEVKMRELTHAHEAPAPVPQEILADKRLRRIDGDQAQCNVCGVWTLFKNWDAHQGGKCEQIRARREEKLARRASKTAGAKGLDALSDLSSDSGDEPERGRTGKQSVRFLGTAYTGGAATAPASGSGSATTASGSGSAGTTATGYGSAGTTTSASAGMAASASASASAPATAAAAAASASVSTTTGTNKGGSASASTVTAYSAAFLAQPFRPGTTASGAGGSAATATPAAVSPSTTAGAAASSSSAPVASSFGPFRYAPVNAKEATGSASAAGPAAKSAPGWTGPVPAFPWKPWVGDPRFAFGPGAIPAGYAQKMYQAQPGMRIVPPGYMPAQAAKGKAKASAPAPAAGASSSASTYASTAAKLSGPASVSTSGPAAASNGSKATPVTGKRAAGPSTEAPPAKKAKVDAASEAGPSKKKVLPLASILAEADARAEAAATAGPATPSAAKSAATTPAAVPPATAKKSASATPTAATPTAATPKHLQRQRAYKRTGPPPPYRPGKNKRATAFSKTAKGRGAREASSSSSSSANSKSDEQRKEWCNAPLPYVPKGSPSRAMEVHHTYQLCGLEVSVSSVHYRTTRFEDLPTDPEALLRLERQVILYYDADVAQVAEDNAIQCKGCSSWVQLPRSGVPTRKWYGSTGHKACCKSNIERRPAAELREAMEGLPEVRFEEPFRIRRIKGDKVQCAGCGKPVSAPMWARHLDERCTFYTLPATAPKYESDGSDSEAPDSWMSAQESTRPQVPLDVTIAKRRAQLLEDVAVREIGDNKLLCDPCGKWVKIAKYLYAEYKWYGPQGHRNRCIAQHPNWKPRADKDEPPLSPATSVPATPAKPGISIPATASNSSVIARRPPARPTEVPPSSPPSVIVIPDTSSDHEIHDDDEYNPDDDGSGAESESSEDPELDV